MNRFFAWLLWSILFGLMPYVIATLVYWLHSGAFLSWSQLVGAGQLMLTSAAVLGGGLKELSQVRGGKHGLKSFLTWSAAVLLLLVGVAYGMVAASAAGATTPLDADRIALASAVVYPVSLLAAAAAIYATRPVASQGASGSLQGLEG